MADLERYFFATDALVKVATKDQACIPLRLFFDRQAHVLTTKQCYEAAFGIFALNHVVQRKARISFSQYFDKVEIVQVESGSTGLTDSMQRYSLDEAGASLIAAIKSISYASDTNKSICYLVTNDSKLIAAAKSEDIDSHNYSEEEFCAKYGS